MALQIHPADRQAVVSAFSKGDNGFRFIRIVSAEGGRIQFQLGARLFYADCDLQPKAGAFYRARLLANGKNLRLQLVEETISEADLSRALAVKGGSLPKRLLQNGDGRLFTERIKAVAEFAGNGLEASDSQAEAFYADLFACRFEQNDFLEQLELFNACGTPPRFRSVVPFEWNGIRGYLDLMVVGNRLVSYRFRLLSSGFDVMIHSDPIAGEMTVDSFGSQPLSAADLRQLSSLSHFKIRDGEKIASALAYADGNPYRELDEWM